MSAATVSPSAASIRTSKAVPRILGRRKVAATPFRPRPKLVLPGLMHATVLPDLELVPLPEVGFDLRLPELAFASIVASECDGPTLHRLLDRLQSYGP